MAWASGKVVTLLRYLGLALCAFAGLGVEMILILVEPMIYRRSTADWSTPQFIGHWVLTTTVWLGLAFWLSHVSSHKYGFDLWATPAGARDLDAQDWAIAFLLVAVSLAMSYRAWNGWKVAKEYASLGLPKFIFQYMYYLAETVLVLLLVVFGQKAGDVSLGLPGVPWGGLLAGLTWGLVHGLTKGKLSMGVWGFCGGVLYGLAYLTVQKSALVAYFIIALMFIL